MISRWIPTMSTCVHANTSWFRDKNSMSYCASSFFSLLSILSTLVCSLGPTSTSISSSTGPAINSSSYGRGLTFVSIGPQLVFSTSIAWGSSGAILANSGDLLQHSLELCYPPQTWPTPITGGNFIVRQWVDVTAFKAFSNGLPSTPLKADGHFTLKK